MTPDIEINPHTNEVDAAVDETNFPEIDDERNPPEIDPETIPESYRNTLNLNLSGAQFFISYSRLIHLLRFLATRDVVEGLPTTTADGQKFFLSRITLGDGSVEFLVYLGDYSLSAVKIGAQWFYFDDSPCTVRGGTQVGFSSADTAPATASMEVGYPALVGYVGRLIEGGPVSAWKDEFLGVVNHITEPARFDRLFLVFMGSLELRQPVTDEKTLTNDD